MCCLSTASTALNINKANVCPNVVPERAFQDQSLYDWYYFSAICSMPKKVCAVHDRLEGCPTFLTQKLIKPRNISKEAAKGSAGREPGSD